MTNIQQFAKVTCNSSIIIVFQSFVNFIPIQLLKITYYIKGNRYHLGERGSATCSIGQLIWDEMTCRNACKFLSIPEKNFKTGYYMCYKDKRGDCNQNGRNDDEARPICQTSGIENKKVKY